MISENWLLYVCKVSGNLIIIFHVGESSGRTSGGGYTGHHPGPEPGSVLLWAGGQCGGGRSAMHPSGGGIHHCRTVRDYWFSWSHSIGFILYTCKYALFFSHTLFMSEACTVWINQSLVMPRQVAGLFVCGGALHCSGAVGAKEGDSLCAVVVMRLSTQL